MASVKIILRKSKKKSSGEAPLWVRIIKDRKAIFKSTGIYIDPKYWNTDKSCIRGNYPDSENFNNLLKTKIARLQLDTVKIEEDNPTAGIKVFKDSLKGLSAYDFYKYAEKFIASYESKGKIGTFNRYTSVMNKLKLFTKEDKVTFATITVPFLKDYEDYMRTEFENAANTIYSNFKVIRRIINEAINDGFFPIEKNPFLKFKVSMQTTEKVYLTESELASFENASLVKGSMKDHHRNMYVFACYAGGVRISDLLTMKWANFDGTHLNLNTKKTGSTVSIKLPPKALEIIKLYKTRKSKANEFIFPILDNDFDYSEPKTLHSAINSATTYTNTDLKDIAKALEFKKHIHFHTSRHTWATRALRKGMRIEYVSKLLGHSSIKTTQVYAKIINADLDKAMEVFNEKEPEVQPEQAQEN